jgi:hypothetical protein
MRANRSTNASSSSLKTRPVNRAQRSAPRPRESSAQAHGATRNHGAQEENCHQAKSAWEPRRNWIGLAADSPDQSERHQGRLKQIVTELSMPCWHVAAQEALHIPLDSRIRRANLVLEDRILLVAIIAQRRGDRFMIEGLHGKVIEDIEPCGAALRRAGHHPMQQPQCRRRFQERINAALIGKQIIPDRRGAEDITLL